ncbi:sensor histidine kinase [Chitinophaga nivalis]|uniref:Histidine kinase n=1 Tax=Chitinophaga nivalis TaxID=2991709 RepID=A0ABT3IK01_9BACT|nr:histidine kinase [Chitinophaga nivalis]MCW3466016.1 histidine kinase [Chitinophaga nivalis]MCW3484293.1 histidine kinase [Chitinophaga nivalis]
MKRHYWETGMHVVIWLTGYLLIAFFANYIGTFSNTSRNFFAPLTVGTLINAGLFYGCALSIIPRYAAYKKIPQLLGRIGLLYTVATAIESMADYCFATSIFSSEKETFTEQIWINVVLNGILVCVAAGYGFTRHWFRREARQQLLEREVLIAERNFLKAQVNPHFLFNSLNMAYASALLHRDEPTANIIDKLSQLMRYMLYESNEDRVRLQQEILYMENFIDLQQRRLADEIAADISFHHSYVLPEHQIAPLLLLPFVENAFKHGIQLDKKSFIRIMLEVEGALLYFSVKNSRGLPQPETTVRHGGIGLDNVRKRLQLLYPGAHVLNIQQDARIFQVQLTINLNGWNHEMHGRR